MPYTKSQSELLRELEEQLAALEVSCKSYDQGNRWEAKRLATTAYVLLHDSGKNSRSLLGQLKMKDSMISTKRHDKSAVTPLANITITPKNGAYYQAFFDQFPDERRRLAFKKWYREVIFESGRFKISRKNLIFTFRSQMGGSHVDPSVDDDAFVWFEKSGPITLTAGKTTSVEPLPPDLEDIFKDIDGPVPYGPHASMRQIAWEILESVQRAH